MRRGLSIFPALFLVLFFGLGPLAPTLDASDDLRLPPCCRRHGAHHCAMAVEMAQTMNQAQSGAEPGSAPIVRTPLTCPFYPGPAALMTGPAPALTSVPAPMPASAERALADLNGRTEGSSRPAITHAGRGPPTAI